MKDGFNKVFIYECKRFIRSPKLIFYTLVFPLMLFGFLGAVFYNEVPEDLPVAYLDNDRSQLSGKLIQLLDASSTIKMVAVSGNLNDAKRMMQEEKVLGYIVIPKDFQKKIHQGLSNEVLCYTNNQFLLPAGLIQKDFLTIIGTFSAGIKIKRDTQSGVQSQKASSEVQPIRTDIHTLFNPYVNYAFYLLVAMMPMMLQMIVIMVTIYVIGIEFKYQKQYLWWENSGHNSFYALWGKLLPYTLSLFFVGWWMNYFLFQRLGVPLKTSMFSVTLITFLLIVIYQLLGISIVSIFNDFRSSLTIGSGFTAIAFSFAAYTFPIEGLPKSMQILADVFPFTHYIEYFVNRAIKGIPVALSWKPLMAMSSFILIFIVSYPKFVNKLKCKEI